MKNSARYGGAIYGRYLSFVNSLNVTFTDNSATDGGAVYSVLVKFSKDAMVSFMENIAV